MANYTLYDLFSEIQPQAMDCPVLLLLQTSRNVVADFCARTGVWREDFTFSLQANVADYAPNPVADAIVDNVISVRKKVSSTSTNYYPIRDHKNRPGPTSIPDLDRIYPQWRDQTSDNGSVTYYTFNDGVITIVPKPTAFQQDWIKGTAIMYPSQDATDVPDVVYERYSQDVAAGVLARLMMMPNKTWSNMQLGQQYNKDYEKAVRSAKWRFLVQSNPRVLPRKLGR